MDSIGGLNSNRSTNFVAMGSSIDSDAVTREGVKPGEYVQWDPCEFFYLQDWNVIHVSDGFDVGQVLTAQRMATKMSNGQPTAIVYRTTKGWQYGVEGKKSHGGGHKMCSDEYLVTQRPVFGDETDSLPSADGSDLVAVEAAEWATLQRYRAVLEEDSMTPFMAAFWPLVPEASSGRRGLLSQTSTPCTRCRPTRMS